MKKTQKIFTTALATVSVLALASGSVLAADVSDYKTDSDINFRDASPTDDPNDLIDPNDPAKEEPVYPGDPGNEVHPNGPLVIDYISRYHFGEVAMKGNNATYYAKLDKVADVKNGPTHDVPNFIQVTDNRGNSAGWSISVRMVQEFTTAAGAKLDKTSLTFQNNEMFARNSNQAPKPSDISIDSPVTVSAANTALQKVGAAKADEGMGSWAVTHGHAVGAGANADKSVKLAVPGTAKKVKSDVYTAKIEWVLTDAPGV